MGFDGFPKDTTKFLKELKKNNNRDWFTRNKSRYKTSVQDPAKEFMEEMAHRLSDLVNQPLAGKTFRIYRDVRFSKDKTPYNPHIRMLFHNIDVASSCGDKPVFCFSLEPDKIITGAGTGTMEFSKSTLESFRTAVDIDESGKALQKLLTKYDDIDGYRIDLPSLKRIPVGYEKDHPRESLLRHKALMVWHEESLPLEVYDTRIGSYLVRRFKKMRPIYNWLDSLK